LLKHKKYARIAVLSTRSKKSKTKMSVETLEAPIQQGVTPEQIEAVAMQFSPRTEVDDQGLTRLILEHQRVTFSFMGREETPVFPTLETAKPICLVRESPRVQGSKGTRYEQEYEEQVAYRDDLGELAEKNKDAPEHILVEQSAYGLFSLLERLDPDNSHWKAEREAVQANEYDDEALLLIDIATALNAAYLKTNPRSEHQPPIGEAIVIAALMGDQQAQRLAQEAVRIQESEEQEAEHTSILKWQAEIEKRQDIEPYKPEDIVVVHTTSYKPESSQEGYEVRVTHDATGYPRSTVHTALNHKVESHIFGNWDNKDYVLVSGFDSMLAANGSPNSINGADTWWTRNPGEKLLFPNATLIGPGETAGELFVRTEDGQVFYKTSGFTSEDIVKAGELFGQTIEEQIKKSLVDESNREIGVETSEAQHIIANAIRDALVRKEITEVRGKPLLTQSDDKYMPTNVQGRLNAMAARLGLKISGALHTGGSTEEYAERVVGQGERLYDGYGDPRIRRVAYASGFMFGGGKEKQNSDARKEWSM
jgi:hypothetical protein